MWPPPPAPAPPRGWSSSPSAQTAGRGRLDRPWVAAARRADVLAPAAPGGVPAALGLAAAAHRVAVAEAVRRVAGVDAYLKWPNDLLLSGDRKLAGILAEGVGAGAVVVGHRAQRDAAGATSCPRPDATSLALGRGRRATDRDPLLRALLRSFADGVRAVAGPATIPAFARRTCSTAARSAAGSGSNCPVGRP